MLQDTVFPIRNLTVLQIAFESSHGETESSVPNKRMTARRRMILLHSSEGLNVGAVINHSIPRGTRPDAHFHSLKQEVSAASRSIREVLRPSAHHQPTISPGFCQGQRLPPPCNRARPQNGP